MAEPGKACPCKPGLNLCGDLKDIYSGGNMKTRLFGITLLFSVSLFAQGGYNFRTVTLSTFETNRQKTAFHYLSYFPDISAVGMGQVQTAHEGQSFGMMSNPAFLAKKNKRFEVFGMQMSFPKSTWDAAWFLEDNMNEFIEAASLNQVWDGVNAFFAPGADLNAKWDAIGEIQNGMAFVVDLLNEVTGPPEAPTKHGFNVLPGIGAQIGNWGFSLYSYGQASFLVRQSPTLDALADVNIPDNLENPLQAAQSVLQMMGILGAGLILESNSFSYEIFPVAYYLSYMDVVGTVGYGKPIWNNLNIGVNLKIINRRFLLDRIPVVDYDQIIENAFKDFSTNITGLTADLGIQMKLPFGTEAGLSLLNLVPVKTLSQTIQMDFMHHQVTYDRVNGEKQVDVNGDTLMIRYRRPVVLNLPYELNLPFTINLGLHHPINSNWSAGLDWLDILRNDSRYDSGLGRLRLGTRYKQPLWKDKLYITARLGCGDEHLCGGLGFKIYNILYLDSAYAWDPVTDDFAYYTQLRIVI